MENNVKKALNNFVDEPEEIQADTKAKKVVKSDFTIVERIDKIIIDESGKQLLREQY